MAWARFELTEGDYWFNEFRASSYNWPWRNQRIPFTELIHDYNSKKIYKLKNIYNFLQIYTFTEWILEDGESMYVIRIFW